MTSQKNVLLTGLVLSALAFSLGWWARDYQVVLQERERDRIGAELKSQIKPLPATPMSETAAKRLHAFCENKPAEACAYLFDPHFNDLTPEQKALVEQVRAAEKLAGI
ncbi:hypothetical protein [Chromobacterium haemolyticum]|uniref:hypothetical protein n=1 Tax=Chromobacterium haemolyticum TaxID=394935 RepID=UPI002448D347|nr:hypothetical protein [Chromobacterium haemolyticum]MDH0342047.1 hypothetical protein [Chromobacterium haemolyticum]